VPPVMFVVFLKPINYTVDINISIHNKPN